VDWPVAALADKALGSPQSAKTAQPRQMPALMQTWPPGLAAARPASLPPTAANPARIARRTPSRKNSRRPALEWGGRLFITQQFISTSARL
jgi:hypothetical protein